MGWGCARRCASRDGPAGVRGRDGGVRTPWAWAMDCFFAWPLPNMTSGVRARLGADDAPSVRPDAGVAARLDGAADPGGVGGGGRSQDVVSVLWSM